MVLGGQDAWRKHPFISGCGKKPFPGFGIAAVLFGAYLMAEQFSKGLCQQQRSRQLADNKSFALEEDDDDEEEEDDDDDDDDDDDEDDE